MRSLKSRVEIFAFVAGLFVLTPALALAAPIGITVTQASDASGVYGGTVTLTATLSDTIHHVPMAGKTIHFSIFGVPVGTATTNASGIATLSNVPLSTLLGVGTHHDYITASYL